MKNLLDFLVKYSAGFVLIIYVLISCVLLVNDNPYQQNVYLTSANTVSASLHQAITSVTGYFHLKEVNTDLEARNASLELQVAELMQQVGDLKAQLPDTATHQPVLSKFDFINANVISNSIAKPRNFITINRGLSDGVKPGMGVVDHNGLVGVVNVAGKHAARVISLLNPDVTYSCKIRNSNFFGGLVWDGTDPRYANLAELPKHTVYNVGDTVITSGYSATFPPGIIIGTITGKASTDADNFIALRVKLFTDFSRLGAVRVITSDMANELQALENTDNGLSKDGKKEGKKDATKLGPVSTTDKKGGGQP